jgi:hypothetical protein
MKSAHPDQRLQQLRGSTERISANLIELELDSSRQLLEATPLEGESAARWQRANSALTELWRCHGLLEDLLKRAEKQTGSGELRALLEGPSIELASADVPLAERTLLGTAQATERCSPEELIRRMSTAFDEVKTVVSRFGQAWEALIPRLESTGRLLEETRRLAGELGDSRHGELDEAAKTLAALRSQVTTDPISVRCTDLDRLTAALSAIQSELQATAGLKRGFETRILEARELLERLKAAVHEAHAAHEELLVKISSPTAPPAPEPRDGLEHHLAEIATLGQRNEWRDARSELERWTSDTTALLDEARRAIDANRAPIEARNQFRALLEAYQVKAGRLGLVEDPRLAEIFERAHRTLYTAPTDLALAAQLVRSYQQALGGSQPIREAMP